MNMTPIAADDDFTATQGQFTTTINGNLGADNGQGNDADPDGTLLGWWSNPFNPQGNGDRFLGAFFNNGVLSFLTIAGTVSYPFPQIVTATLITTAEGGQVILSTNGSFTYTAPKGFSGTDWFEYTLVDGEFGFDTGRVTFNVNDSENGNDRPQAKDDVFNGVEDQQISGNVLASNGNGVDTDPNGDALTVNNQTIYTAHGGLVSIYANGDFVYRPPANYSGPDSFEYTVKDSHGAAATATVTLNLEAANDAPIANADSFSGVHGKPISGNVMANDVDADNDPLTAVAATIETAGGGQAVLMADGTFTYTPLANYAGIDSFTYTVTDGHGGLSMATVSLNVLNTDPVALTDWYTAQFGKGISGNVLRNDSDADGDPLRALAATITTAHGGTAVLKADGTFTYVPPEAFYGTDSFQYTIKDGFGGAATAIALITTTAPSGSIYGTTEYDNISGTASADHIFAFAEDDIVHGRGGNDAIDGGDEDDRLWGEDGADRLYGQGDGDLLKGGNGADYLSGGSDSDDLYGDAGNDRLLGGAGADKLYGGAGKDQFIFAAPGGAADKVMDFKAGDKLTVMAADFGLAAGALPDASYFAKAGAADVGHGRFIYTSANRALSWDEDGDTATANQVIAVFDKSVTLGIADFLVI